MKKQMKKLVLAKETLRSLETTTLTDVIGGAPTIFNTCECPVSIVDCIPEANVDS
jgi:hypothetical protein